MANSQKLSPMQHYNVLVERQDTYRKRRFFRKHLVVVLILAISAFLFYSYQQHFHDEESVIIPVLLFTAFVLFALYPYRTGWLLSSDFYYLIDGSTDNKGNHRCIKCGGRGIWRSGVYKSSHVYCYCSKCKFGLWRE